MRLARSVRVAIAAILSLGAPLALAAGSSDSPGPCAEKAARIDAQIAQAKAKGNSKTVATLERARSEMVHCSDDGLREKRNMALQQAQQRIDLRQADLKKAEASGDPAKIKKAQRDLDGARKVYAQIESSPL
jgi:hypothetical protein